MAYLARELIHAIVAATVADENNAREVRLLFKAYASPPDKTALVSKILDILHERDFIDDAQRAAGPSVKRQDEKAAVAKWGAFAAAAARGSPPVRRPRRPSPSPSPSPSTSAKKKWNRRGRRGRRGGRGRRDRRGGKKGNPGRGAQAPQEPRTPPRPKRATDDDFSPIGWGIETPEPSDEWKAYFGNLPK
ncbi:hypothetical protein F5Y13DRAFT_193985 [Hypoxylon sp. FL1857]|nr:hypothetical protein F5Y13DRAFT_193985 [Hypoxylon sp. FL1857]